MKKIPARYNQLKPHIAFVATLVSTRTFHVVNRNADRAAHTAAIMLSVPFEPTQEM